MEKTPVTSKHFAEFDDVFVHVNSYGRYQCLLFHSLNMLVIFPLCFQFGFLVFGMGTPHFHCDVTNTTCPPNQCCSNCTSYSFDGPFTSTVSEWNLICDRAPTGATLQTCYFLGMLFGSLLSGGMSDRFGRKMVLFVCFAIMDVAILGSIFTNSIPLFGFLRFVCGFGLMSAHLAVYTLNMEIVGPNKRTLAANQISVVYWRLPMVVQLAVFYLVREWRMTMVVSLVPSCLLFLFWWAIPRSPRWLVAHGHLDEALKTLMKFGGKNKNAPDPVALRALLEDVRRDQLVRRDSSGHGTRHHTPIDLFRTPKMRRWSILLCYNWFVTAFASFGLLMFVTSLAGDIYLNYFILTALHVPAALVLWFLHKTIGRRIPNAVLLLNTGLFLLAIVGIPEDRGYIRSILALTGSMWIGATWVSVYLITSELFPTVLRNTALGTGSTAARVGGVLSPYMAMLGHLPGAGMSLPVAIWGGLALLGAITTYWLPETMLKNMHQTIEEAEAAQDYYGSPCCKQRDGRDLEENEVRDHQETKQQLIEMESAI